MRFTVSTQSVAAVTVDGILGGEAVDLMKYDTEGAEAEALRGSLDTIRRHLPRLRVAVYHRSEDIFSILLQIERAVPNQYRYYLRRRACIPAWETELLAIPKGETKDA